ncbi:recombinase family protein [Lachnospiraceae bacterium 46-15]
MQIFIYSRKSKWTGRGESIENQVQMCRDYIESYIPGADLAEIRVFEDEGYSGKNVKRPEFQRMMAEIRKGSCHYLVCYKLDRLGRNIIDIAGLVEELNNLKVSFISIKENFDTSTPLGKTMLYIAGIFAQMEREQIAERVKDNMVMLAKSGRWLGGNTPLGFFSQKDEKVQINDKIKTSYRLAENPQEMITVRFIFREYLEKQSLAKVVEYFLRNDIQTKRGKEYTPTAVRDILTNPVYCTADETAYDYFESLGCQMCFSREEADGRHGIIAYAKTSSASYKNRDNPPEEWIVAMGKHKGEIPGAEFERVQKLLGANKQKGEACRNVRNEVALLSGILFCACGHAMRPKYYSVGQVTDGGERKFSYLCPYKDATHSEKCSVENVPGNDLDEMVCRELFRYAEPDSQVKKLLDKLGNEFEKGRGHPADKLDLLKQALEEKEQGIKNLLAAIKKQGRSQAFIEYADEEISKLGKECEELKEKIKSCGNGEGTPICEKHQVDLLAEQLDSFAKAFQVLTVPKKREYLRMLLDKVVWDGEKAQIFLYGSR